MDGHRGREHAHSLMTCKNQGVEDRQVTGIFCLCHGTFFTILIPCLPRLPHFLTILVYSIAQIPFSAI